MTLSRSAPRAGLRQEHFVVPDPVHVGGVEEGDPQVDGPAEERDRGLVVRRSVELGHAHAPETDRGDFDARSSQYSLFHSK